VAEPAGNGTDIDASPDQFGR
jgi:hypothetical protein